MRRDTARQWINVLVMVATVVVNALASILPLNGLNTGEISDRFRVYFVPAGYVFSIWGLIYLALAAFAVYQAVPSQRDNPLLRRMGYLFALSSVANITWLFLWHYEVFSLTLFAMLAILLTLIVIYLRLGTGRTKVSAAERWLVQVPFSIYLGWITVATIANATQLLDYLNWSGWGISPEIWTVIMLGAATLIGSLVSLTRGDIAYMLVLIWAFAGIAIKHTGTPLVAIAAWLAVGLVALLMVVGAIFHTRRARRLA